MNKHTPGPWGLTDEKVGFSVRSSHTKENDYASEHICSMDHYRQERLHKRSANANLIAAAPELFDVVKKALFVVDKNHKLFAQLHAAIAKAEGVTMDEYAGNPGYPYKEGKALTESVEKMKKEKEA